MQFTNFINPITAVMALLSSPVLSQLISVHSHCDYPVYCALVTGVNPSDPTPETPEGPRFSAVPVPDGMSTAAVPERGDVYHCSPDPNPVIGEISLLEWTYNTTDPVRATFWWDLSFVDGNPFRAEGNFVANTDIGDHPTGEWPKCYDSYCAPGVDCGTDQVYLTPDSDRNPTQNPMRQCPPADHLVWHICSH